MKCHICISIYDNDLTTLVAYSCSNIAKFVAPKVILPLYLNIFYGITQIQSGLRKAPECILKVFRRVLCGFEVFVFASMTV